MGRGTSRILKGGVPGTGQIPSISGVTGRWCGTDGWDMALKWRGGRMVETTPVRARKEPNINALHHLILGDLYAELRPDGLSLDALSLDARAPVMPSRENLTLDKPNRIG